MIVVVGKENPAYVEAAGAVPVRFVESLEHETFDGVQAVIGHLPADVLDKARELRWVHSPSAGVDSDLTPEMIASPVVLTSSAGNGGISLAEHSILLMMMLNRDVPRWMRAQAEHRWDHYRHGELAGRTVGIYGLGNSGLDLALKAKAFHMRVLGVRRRPEQPSPNVDELCDFGTLLSESDFVVVTTPRTPATTGVFDRAAFARMKPTAYFVNISRGGIADDDALLEALTSGQIAGAGLDAHGVEPLPPDSPFWSLPNVVVTPHNGATSDGTLRRSQEIVADNIRRFVTGEPLHNVVDKAAGY
ncbi:D-2-hydroxyacid dehydrogenase [Kribbella sp. NPDC004875]|uniref:D-2-hydroxyacid dehydrogenase n=1 Tax=Kribbella sp. NPDC004875 TaxID=3364107 RepID=UPI00368EFBD2